MTTALADLLAARLRPLPFLQRVAGLARPVDRAELTGGETQNGEPATRRTRTPEALAFPPGTAPCEADEKYLLPDLETASIFFFEDYGTTDVQLGGGLIGKESTLRLLGWLNPKCYDEPLEEAPLLEAIQAALKLRVRKSEGAYDGLTVTATVLPAEAALFSKYTYAADLNPMLYPPFLVLGLELKCRYRYLPACPVPELPTFRAYQPC